MRCNTIYETVERKIGSVFAKYGRFVSHHAWKIIVATIIINGALGIGMMKLQSNTDAGDVYLPQGTQARKDKDRVESIFPDLSGSNYNSLHVTVPRQYFAGIIVKSKTSNLLNRPVLEEIKALSELIQNIVTTDSDGSTINFSDVCAISNSQCSLGGELFWDPDFLTAVDNNVVTYPEFNSTTKGTQNYARDVGGSLSFDGTGQYLTKVIYLTIVFNIRTDGDQYKKKGDKWVDAFRVRLESFSSSNIDIAYGHHNSLDEELDKNVSGDIALFAATISLMITYACVACLSARFTDQVGQRMWLGFAGILAAGFAIVSSFGLCAAIGVEFVSIVGVVPFLVIGIGIDDMFILLSGLSEAQNQKTVEDKIAETLRISGVGITITSLTDLIAFMSGAASSFIAVKHFCIYTGVAVLFCYINNITFFTACLVINERRVEDNRHFMTCRRIKTKEDLLQEGKSKKYIFCCGGQAPKGRDEAESLVDKFPRWLVPKIVLKLPLKIIIIFLFMGYLAAAIYGCINLKQGLLFTQLVNDDSYFWKYSDWKETHFKRQTAVSFVIPSTYEYSAAATQTMVSDLISSAQSHKYFDNSWEVNWLKTYSTSSHYDGSSESAFITGLTNFISDQNYRMFENDVKIDTINQKITASRVYVLSVDLANSQAEGKMMLESRKIASAAAIDCFSFAPAFIAFEQYVLILPQTLQSVGIALAAVFVVTCIFMPHPILITFVTVAVTMIMIGVFGYILYLDVALSAITMIHLIMSIGFSVDFTAHICHGYMISTGQTRDMRVKQAIDKTGAPIFHGAVSSLLGILILVGAKSYIFRTFAAVMAFVLLFGIAHALLLLPVVLSWMGPSRVISVQDNQCPEDESDIKTKSNEMNGKQKEELCLNGNVNESFTNLGCEDGNKKKQNV
ncbi:patched domain-containing protein 3-like [Ruditapes philippinarum]|uniref:patched domain-containing protein 3-like n=1 Tax=Ruditapes philippinarum TaxID=129788 RepID=UPI00295C27D0|nr:patched domain-containing protein 3-like [Ruditapes philippinarum]